MFKRLIFITVILIFSAACTNVAPTPVELAIVPEPSPTQVVLPTAEPTVVTPAPTQIPTEEAMPTSTPAATEESEPTPAPNPTKETVPTPTEVAAPTVNSLPDPNDILLFDFTSYETTGRWFIVNDSVMGGISESAAALAEPGVLVFSGTVSLENNGGFASLRSEPTDYKVPNADALRLRVLGDGQTYRLRVRTDSRLDGVAYDQPFDTVAGEWVEVVLPISEFKPQWRGRILTDRPALTSANMTSLGIMITDKQEGSFSLSVDWISAVMRMDSAEIPLTEDA